MARKSKNAAESAPASEIAIAENTKPTDLQVIHVEVGDIVVPKDKTDRTRDAAFHAGVRELAANIAEVGLRQPITLRAGKGKDAPFEIVAGERRWLAAVELNWETIPAIIAEEGAHVPEIRAAENLQRADLDDEKKALAIGDLVAKAEEVVCAERNVLDPCKLDPPTQDAVRTQAIKRVATKIGWPPARVRDFAFIADLPEETRALGGAGRLSISHLRVLSQVPNSDQCDELAAEFAAGENPAREPMLPLDELKTRVSRECSKLSGVPWSLDAVFAGGPACNKCPNNSRNKTGLFEGDAGLERYGRDQAVPEVGVCLKLSCFRAKNNASKSAIRGAADRIVTKAKAAKHGEKEATINGLIRAATEKTSFVTPTVFGKEVRARIKSKMATSPGEKSTSVGKSGSRGGFTKETPEQKARDVAQRKYEDAARKWRQREVDALTKALMDRPISRLLISWLVQTETYAKACTGRTYQPKEVEKAKRHAETLKPLIDRCIRAAPEDVRAIADLEPERGSDGMFCSYDFDSLEDLLEHCMTVANVPGRARPRLENFLPKPKVEKPAATPAKKHDASKAAPAPKPAGKKKAKKSKPAPAKKPVRLVPDPSADAADIEIDEDGARDMSEEA